MLKRLLKCAALICAMALTLSLFGCSDTSWAVKVGNNTMPSGVYLFWLTQASSSVKQNASSGTDPWAQTVSGGTAVTYATNSALDYTKQCAEIENLCANLKIKSTATDTSSAVSFASNEMKTNSGTYSGNGISSTSLQRVYEDFAILRPKLFTAIYGKGGAKAVSDADLVKFSADYSKVKHIVILTNDSAGAALTGDALAKVDATYKEALAAAQIKGANFDQLMTKYTQDVDANGAPNSPTGYLFTKASAATSGFDQTFIDTAFKSKVGDITGFTASYGYDIMLRVPLDPTDNTTLLSNMKSAEFVTYIQDQITKEKFQKNDAAINYYNPRNLK
jgi:hypothetical protein